MRTFPSVALFAALILWMAGWVWVIRSSGWVPLLPGWLWLLAVVVSAAPLEVLYRACRPAQRRVRVRLSTRRRGGRR